jgi:hypothetical protein
LPPISSKEVPLLLRDQDFSCALKVIWLDKEKVVTYIMVWQVVAEVVALLQVWILEVVAAVVL